MTSCGTNSPPPKPRKGLLAFYVGMGAVLALVVGFYFAWTPLRVWYWQWTFSEELSLIRGAKWPHRAASDEAYMRVFEETNFKGMPRTAVLRALGPPDGVVIIEESKSGSQGIGPVRKPRLTSPHDDRLMYRLGDGHNAGPVYTLHFENGFVSRVTIAAGY
jgi:hypothetical protein